MKDKSAFLTQKGRRRGHSDDVVGANQPGEVLAGIAQTSQSTLLLRKKKEMREVAYRVCVVFNISFLTSAAGRVSGYGAGEF